VKLVDFKDIVEDKLTGRVQVVETSCAEIKDNVQKADTDI
jgi:peptidoglycan hydrolase CwlO-like protein